MPYDYRKLTEQERQEVLDQRRARGYPLHAPPHPIREAGYYLITAANYEHAPIMIAPDRRTAFEGRLLEAVQSIRSDLVGWVILPNHYHLLVGVDALDCISMALKQLHGVTAREWNLADGLAGQRRVWYKFSDRFIRGEEHYLRALNYIHYNPVKHGWVGDVYEWPWSSVHDYFETYGREWLREQWKAHTPGDFGRGWDD